MILEVIEPKRYLQASWPQMCILYPPDHLLPPLFAQHPLVVQPRCVPQQVHEFVGHGRKPTYVGDGVSSSMLWSDGFKKILVVYAPATCRDVAGFCFFLGRLPTRLEESVLIIHLLVISPFLCNVVQSPFEENFFAFAAFIPFTSRRVQDPDGSGHSAQCRPRAHLVHRRDHADDRIDPYPSGNEYRSVDSFTLLTVQRGRRIDEISADLEADF